MADDEAQERTRDLARRHHGREMALQMLYQWESAGTHPSEVLRSFDLELFLAETVHAEQGESEASADTPAGEDAASTPEEPLRAAHIERQIERSLGPKPRSRAYQFAKDLFLGVIEHQQGLDDQIAAAADNWRIERMSRVDRNILRIALHEAVIVRELPKAVIIDEAVELAKRFGGENSSSFVNGVLDATVRDLE